MTEPKLTAVQQDYLEACFVLEGEEREGVRVTDLAERLGTKLPTVTRTIGRLKAKGLVTQKLRGPVRMTARGRKLAAQLLHRHEDAVQLLTEVLGVPADRAEDEACVIEHGISGDTAQRLHEFLEHWEELPAATRRKLAAGRRGKGQFGLVGDARGSGKRH